MSSNYWKISKLFILKHNIFLLNINVTTKSDYLFTQKTDWFLNWRQSSFSAKYELNT